MLVRRMVKVTFAIISFLSLNAASNCPLKDDSPILKIFVHPEQIVKGITKNISIDCLVERREKVGLNPVTKTVLWITNVNGARLGKPLVYYNSKLKPYNISTIIGEATFGNDSALHVHCMGTMNTDSCTETMRKLILLESIPTRKTPIINSPHIGLEWIGIAAVAVLLLVLFVIYWKYRNYRKRQRALCVNLDPIEPQEGAETEYAIGTLPVYASDESRESDTEVELSDCQRLFIPTQATPLGQGNFGSVVLGQLRYKKEGTEPKEVAVKILKDFDNAKHKKDFEGEVKILTPLDHPNIVKLLGFCVTDTEFYIIMEYLKKGSLLNLLHQDKETRSKQSLARFAYDIACGMEYLANKKILHRDLAARNILVADDDSAKISDFGLARNVEKTGQYVSIQGYIALKWSSPEALDSKSFTTKCDVWSYGVVLWEIFSYGEDPYGSISGSGATGLRDFLRIGKRLDRPKGCPAGIHAIMNGCWRAFPESRPSFSKIKQLLEKHVEELEAQASEIEG